MTDRRANGYLCTPENPWKPEYGYPVAHSHAREVGDQEDGRPGGDVVRMECAVCGAKWKQELPQ